MTEMFNIMHGEEKVDKENNFPFAVNTRTQCNSLKLISSRFRTDNRTSFEHIVTAIIITDGFKRGLDHLRSGELVRTISGC